MPNLKIYDYAQSTSVEMPYTRRITPSFERVVNRNEMASGKVVFDVKGYRKIVVAEYEAIDNTTLLALNALIQNNSLFYIEYPNDITGATESGYYTLEAKKPIFKVLKGCAMWYNLALTFTAQEVST